LRGSAAQFGFSEAGPYSSLSECVAMAGQMGIVADCSCTDTGDDGAVYIDPGPTPQQIEHMRLEEERRLAEQRAREAERERQRQVTYYNQLGNDMLRSARFDEAIRAYEAALALGPDPVVYGNLNLAQFRKTFAQGRAFFDGRQWDEAIATFRVALAIRPGDTATEANIRAAENNKQNQLIYEEQLRQYQERRRMFENAFAGIQQSIEDHISFAESIRGPARKPPDPAKRRTFGDPESASDQAVREKIAVLDEKIERDLQAIRNLGLGRNVSDFHAWARLAYFEKRAFEDEVDEAVGELSSDLVKGALLNRLKTFDRATAARWSNKIESLNLDPKPTALLERLKAFAEGTSQQLGGDADILVKEIDAFTKMYEGHEKKKETLKVVADLLEVFVDDPKLKILLAEIKVAAAALFNNATRRVALHEVERLTTMTEKELKALAPLQRVLTKHVKERAELKAILQEPAS
jgi:tetratricopeptide (TPR) repeat protein